MTRDHPALSADARQPGALSWWWLGAGLIRILAPLGALILEGWPALIGTLLVQEGGLWLSGHLVGGCQRRRARGLFVGAWGLRMSIVLPTHYVAMLGNDNGALYRDDYTNDLVGEWLVRIARGDGGVSIFPGHQYLLDSIYTYVLMAIYAIFGYSPLLPKVLNIGLAALCVVLVFDIARKVFSQRAAMLAALGAAVLPSLVVWSIASLKETLVLAAALLALWLVQFLSTAGRRDRRIVDAGVALVAV
ncbi:MAG TPA: glycosyltransferase family 39 protein, partial [Chloroflexota bacterium]